MQRLAIPLFCTTLLLSCLPAQDEHATPDYRAAYDHWVQLTSARDSFFMSPASPLLEDQKRTFESLTYFPYDSSYVFRLRLRPELDRDTLVMTTSTGEQRPYIPLGTFRFDAEGKGHVLSVFKSVESGTEQQLFLPFRDLTSSRSTYGGGRYIDLEIDSTGIYTLDFNLAYQPYCTYNPAYSCPIPPPENRLDVAITAGERLASVQ